MKEIDEFAAMVARVAVSGYRQGPHSGVAPDAAQGRRRDRRESPRDPVGEGRLGRPINQMRLRQMSKIAD